MTYSSMPSSIALACSHNIFGDLKRCDQAAIDQAQHELRRGYPVQHHNLFRNVDRPQDVKFNIPISGIPLFLYALRDVDKAGFEKILVIGNSEVHRIVDAYQDFFKSDKIKFVYEGELDQLSRSNTIRLQLEEFKGDLSGPSIEISGDTPFVDTDALRNDPDNLKYNIMLHVNVQQVAGTFYPRNYHWRFTEEDNDGVRYTFDAKEPNAWVWDLPYLFSHGDFGALSDALYSSRKAFGSKIGMFARVVQVLAFDGYLPSTEKLSRIWNQTSREEKNEIVKSIKGVVTGKRHKTTVRSELATFLSPNIVGKGAWGKLKAARQPGLAVDVDSIEDVLNVQQVLNANPNVYPHFEELQAFGRHMNFKWGVELTDKWSEIANEKLKLYGVDAEYSLHGGLAKGLFNPEMVNGQVDILLAYLKSRN